MSDVPAIRAILGRAYLDDPLTAWIFRDPDTRLAACAAWYGLFVEAYAAAGHITHLVDEQAVCLWGLPEDPPPEQGIPTIAALLDALVGPEHGARVADALHAITPIIPDRPMAYVNFLAVDPARQGQGHGRAAIQPALDAARAAGLAVRLETTNPRNVAFYERLGFRQTTEMRIGADGPTLRAMRLDVRQ